MKTTYTTLADFEPWELDAFADGEPLPHVAAFVATNRAEWAAWLATEGQPLALAKTLFRFDCPPVDELRDYLWQQLSPLRLAHLADHLHGCPHCSDELSTLRTLLAQPATNLATAAEPPPWLRDLPQRLQNWWQQAKADLALAVAQLVPPPPTPALSALRSTTGGSTTGGSTTGGSANTMLLYETAGLDISLLIAQTAPQVRQLSGQLYSTATEPTGTIRWWGATAEQGDGTSPISTNGTFTIEAITPGAYHLVVQLPTQQIIIPQLTIS